MLTLHLLTLVRKVKVKAMDDFLLKQVFVGWDTGDGIFPYLSENADLPWESDSDIDDLSLDLAYFGNNSGCKFTSPLVNALLTSGVLSAQSRNTLAKVIISKYKRNWDRLWATFSVDYNPIHNYDMTETRERLTSNARAESEGEDQSHTGTDTLAHGKVETTQHGKGTTGMDYKYGINTDTESPKPSDKSTVNENGTTIVTDSGSDVDTKNLTDTRTSDKNAVEAGEETEQEEKQADPLNAFKEKLKDSGVDFTEE